MLLLLLLLILLLLVVGDCLGGIVRLPRRIVALCRILVATVVVVGILILVLIAEPCPAMTMMVVGMVVVGPHHDTRG